MNLGRFDKKRKKINPEYYKKGYYVGPDFFNKKETQRIGIVPVLK